ncbi:MAG: hypothetical protein AB1631_15555 [Acidobacteriota bacterium]
MTETIIVTSTIPAMEEEAAAMVVVMEAVMGMGAEADARIAIALIERSTHMKATQKSLVKGVTAYTAELSTSAMGMSCGKHPMSMLMMPVTLSYR